MRPPAEALGAYAIALSHRFAEKRQVTYLIAHGIILQAKFDQTDVRCVCHFNLVEPGQAEQVGTAANKARARLLRQRQGMRGGGRAA